MGDFQAGDFELRNAKKHYRRLEKKSFPQNQNIDRLKYDLAFETGLGFFGISSQTFRLNVPKK